MDDSGFTTLIVASASPSLELGVIFLVSRARDQGIVLSNILIIIGCVAAAMAFLFLVSRTSTAPSRKESNDFTGAVVAVIGTTYAVILAFTLAGRLGDVSTGAGQ